MGRKLMAALVCAAILSSACVSRHIKDTTKPTITSTTPTGGVTAVAVNTAITAVFSKAMDQATINDETFTLVSGVSGSTVAGTVTYDAGTNTATLVPSSALSHDEPYTASVSTAARDLAGNTLGSSFTWSFRTIPAPGSLDTSFGSGGTVKTSVGNSHDFGTAAALQQDGKIVVVGYSTIVTAPATTIFTLVRYNPNGAPDTAFGLPLNSGGKVTDFAGAAYSVAIQPDGKIIAAGTTEKGADFLIARYNADGRIDANFGASGQVILDFGGTFENVNAIAVQGDGKIVIAGDRLVTAPTPTASSIVIARFNADGTLDATFNGTGNVINTSYDNSWAKAVKIQPDGKILVAGHFQNASGQRTLLISRYDQNGHPDTSFNSTGTAIASRGIDPLVADMLLLPDGKILAAGTTTNAANGSMDIILLRFHADGSPDTTFGSDGTGTVYSDLNASDEYAAALGTDAGGKILIAATYRKKTGQPLTTDFAVLRYSADGAPDLTFGGGFGIVHSDFGGGLDDFPSGMQVQPDGKILVVGSSWAGNAFDIGLCRYWQ